VRATDELRPTQSSLPVVQPKQSNALLYVLLALVGVFALLGAGAVVLFSARARRRGRPARDGDRTPLPRQAHRIKSPGRIQSFSPTKGALAAGAAADAAVAAQSSGEDAGASEPVVADNNGASEPSGRPSRNNRPRNNRSNGGSSTAGNASATTTPSNTTTTPPSNGHGTQPFNPEAM
jgi:hypothetical protein